MVHHKCFSKPPNTSSSFTLHHRYDKHFNILHKPVSHIPYEKVRGIGNKSINRVIREVEICTGTAAGASSSKENAFPVEQIYTLSLLARYQKQYKTVYALCIPFE